MVVIADYGVGNLQSILNMLKRVQAPAVISSDASTVAAADKIILPGVGNFDYCMQQLRKASFFDVLHNRALEQKVPVLGVCVGSQMLMESSEEGNEPGLGWLKGRVIKFNKEKLPQNYKVPHMGWSDIHPTDSNGLYNGIAEPRFYFVHSYHIETDPSLVTATADYGYTFTASVGREHIQGVQFHPEKSHKFGMQLYANFVNRF